MLHLLVILSLFRSGGGPAADPQKASLTVEVHNVLTREGAVYIALFKPGQEFPSGKPTDGKKVEATGNNVKATFSVEPGVYAIAVFHDENNNGKMDKRIFGIPKEPYGFSNNFRPKMSAPKFSDCQFSVGNGGKTVSIDVKKF